MVVTGAQAAEGERSGGEEVCPTDGQQQLGFDVTVISRVQITTRLRHWSHVIIAFPSHLRRPFEPNSNKKEIQTTQGSPVVIHRKLKHLP
jgi:hypothetical protein